eukprot:337981-Chlamydomonas_euryale.AAC.2
MEHPRPRHAAKPSSCRHAVRAPSRFNVAQPLTHCVSPSRFNVAQLSSYCVFRIRLHSCPTAGVLRAA